jgi:hypothetical protein
MRGNVMLKCVKYNVSEGNARYVYLFHCVQFEFHDFRQSDEMKNCDGRSIELNFPT